MISVETALRKIRAEVRPNVGLELLAVDACLNRVLASVLLHLFLIHPFDKV